MYIAPLASLFGIGAGLYGIATSENHCIYTASILMVLLSYCSYNESYEADIQILRNIISKELEKQSILS